MPLTPEQTTEILKLVAYVFGVGGTIITSLLLWGVKAWIAATIKNTQEVAILNSQIKNIMDNNNKIPKLQDDIQALHDWRRKHMTKDHH